MDVSITILVCTHLILPL